MNDSKEKLLLASLSLLLAVRTIDAQEFSNKNVRVVESSPPQEVRTDRKNLQESVPASSDFVARLSPAIKSGAAQPWTSPFQQTVPGFRVQCESGTENPSIIRLQISSDQYYAGPGDGGTLDVARQLFELMPGTGFIAAIERKHLDGFLRRLAEWRVDPHLVILPQDLPVAQWAQDNGKSGRIRQSDGAWKSFLLVPRYASRGESPTTFVPGESFLADALAQARVEVAQSPLIFQGGNLLPVFDPARKKTILLMGEAEVYRNAVPGRTNAEIVEAFKIEFGADECVVLPAASFHIDYEVTARTVGDHVVAFVNDPTAAHQLVLNIGLRILELHRIIDRTQMEAIRASVAAKDWCSSAALIEKIIEKLGGPDGRFSLQVSEWFQQGGADSGVGNLQRFLASCDFFCSECPSSAPATNRKEYLQSVQSSQTHRTALIAQLQRLGWQIAHIPSTSDDELSLNFLNGIQTRDRFLMPIYGGIFNELDRAARASFERAVPGLKVEGVSCGESQRRNGALHCSVSVL